MTKSIWENKLVAWLHDPAEKSFVLFSDPSGHEGGTVRTLLNKLKDEIGLEYEKVEQQIKQADWLAAAADRPQWPRDISEGKHTRWSQVDFGKDPVLIHPLTGDRLKLHDLTDINYKQIKQESHEHFDALLKLGKDAKTKFLALWRFGPEHSGNLGQLWQLLPADTRVPDHSIWNHLDLTSALAGSMYDKQTTAILSMSFGPVQSFIAQARSTSDLWAGSHLLSSIVWEAMKVIADEIGPDAFLFPQIRGLAIVDTWLIEKAKEAGLDKEWNDKFNEIGADWKQSNTDSNPLFAACLPNKFSAIVPLSKAKELAEKAAANAKKAVKDWAIKALEKISENPPQYAIEQIEAQLHGFPNIFYSIVEWGHDISDSSQYLSDLKDAVSLYTDKSESFFEQDYLKYLKHEVVISGKKFWEPRSSVLYPALYDLAEKSLATSKALRSFEQLPQEGFRCTLCAEREWLSENRNQLSDYQGKNTASKIWKGAKGNLIKKGEHLCAVCNLKRFWPQIFIDKVSEYTDFDTLSRYVISTHTMSLIPTINAIIDKNGMDDLEKVLKLEAKISQDAPPVALPKKLYRECKKRAPEKLETIKRIPSYIDYLKSFDDSENELSSFIRTLEKVSKIRTETYYALIMMDGDNMGAWLSATETSRRIAFADVWHPKVKENPDFIEEQNQNSALKKFCEILRTASPGRHAAISQALNNFSSTVAPRIVEDRYCGKLIYSGGDDVLAMAPTDDLLAIIKDLRTAYSGFGKKVADGESLNKTDNYSQKGFVLSKKRLLQAMGAKASASVGVVIVHSQTPLAYALKCLREAERMAKNAGRNAFCIRILKRAGGEISFTDNWWNESENTSEILDNGFDNSSIGLFEELVKKLAQNDKMSRKAFYGIEEWAHLLPDFKKGWKEEDWTLSKEMAEGMLVKQFSDHKAPKELASKLVNKIWSKAKQENNKTINNPIQQLKDILFCAEFFARETRSYKKSKENKA